MLSLRHKFILGNVGLLAIIVVASGIGVTVARRTSQAVEKMFHANYDTVVACQHMSDAAKAITLQEQFSLMGQGAVDAGVLSIAVKDFESNLHFQQHNITEPGEQAATDLLASQWASFSSSLQHLRHPALGLAQRRTIFEHELLPVSLALETSTRNITALNLKNMSIVEGRASVMAKEAAQWAIGLILLALILAGVGVTYLGRWVLQPIRAVTESAKEIAAGNLDLAVAESGEDEMGQMAHSFNLMTAKLRELRQSNRAKLVKVQRSTQRSLEALRDGVAFMGLLGEVELANPVAQRLFDLKSNGPPGPQCPTELITLLQNCRRDVRGFEPKTYSAALQVFDMGRERFFLPRVEVVMDEERSLAGFALVLVDVTALRQVDEMKSSVVATVSHELKTPLTGLRMALYLLLDEKTGQLSSKQEELLIAARQDAERLHEILNSLLDIGRLESGQGALNLSPCGSVKLVLDAMDSERPAYHDKGVRLESELSDEDPRVMVDPTRLRHVFSNLLQNALKHTPSGGLVRVSTSREGDKVRFSVADDGEGIPPQFLPRLFEKFFRVPGQSSASGAGLGLAIAKEIVEAHGGSIEAKSQLGQGSVLSFLLKAA
jgi:NtrC-family two-component system sensor histidine kinase KinB